MITLCADIVYDREEGEVIPTELPKTMLVCIGAEDEYVTDVITERTGFCVSSCNQRELTAFDFSRLLAAAMARKDVKILKTPYESHSDFIIDGIELEYQSADVVFGCLIEDELAQTETE